MDKDEDQIIKATLLAFGPDEGVTFTQDTWSKLHAAMSAVVAQPAPVQEPVAWGMPGKDGFIFDVICPEEHTREEGGYTVPLYTTPPAAPVQERCEYCDGTGDVHDQTGEWRGTCHCVKAAQRQWVGLTDEEIDKHLSEDAQGDCEMHEYARAIEAKLKEKNT
jgi:hypothetical protein